MEKKMIFNGNNFNKKNMNALDILTKETLYWRF
jgi:hypothetical protein